MAEPNKEILNEATADALFKDIVAQANELHLKDSNFDYATRTLTFTRHDDINHTRTWAERWNKEVGFDALKVTTDNKVTYTIQPGQDEKPVRRFHALFDEMIDRGRFADLLPPREPEPKTDYEKALRLVHMPNNGNYEQRTKDLDALLSKAHFSQDQINGLLHEAANSVSGWVSYMPGYRTINPFVDKMVTEYSADVNSTVNGERPLHISAKNADIILTLYFLGKGADANLANDAGKKPREMVPHIEERLEDLPKPEEIREIKNEIEKHRMIRDYAYIASHEDCIEKLAEAEKNPEKFREKPEANKPAPRTETPKASNNAPAADTTAAAQPDGNENAEKKAPPENPGDGGKGGKNFLEDISPEMAGGGIGLAALAAGLFSGMDFFMALILAVLAGVAAKFGMEYMAKQKESAAPDPNTGAAVAQPEINQGAALSRQRDYGGLALPENRLAVSDLPPPDQFRPTGGIPGAANGRVRG